ncbi:MAG: DUF5343 domain-containing protein [Nitrosarchaeum sp.]
MSKEETKLPYHGDIELFEKMLNDLKTAGIEGINVETMWANIGASKDNMRSFTLNLGKFVGLVDSDNKKAWLTDLGTTLRYMSKEERGKVLSQKLPDKYLTMFKWIQSEKEMKSNEIKKRFIQTWGNIFSTSVLDRAITTFLNYADWLNIIIYQGRGNQAKAVITELGKRVLELNPNELHTDTPPKHNGDSSLDGKQNKELTLPTDATYPIIVKTNDRDFHWDIKSEADWTVIDSVIASIKEGWKLKQQPENSSNHIKGKKDSPPST